MCKNQNAFHIRSMYRAQRRKVKKVKPNEIQKEKMQIKEGQRDSNVRTHHSDVMLPGAKHKNNIADVAAKDTNPKIDVGNMIFGMFRMHSNLFSNRCSCIQ